MKKPTKTQLLLVVFFSIITLSITAQSTTAQTGNRNLGTLTDLESLQNDRRIYLLDSFTRGTVFLKNRTVAHAVFNYNLLTQQMQMLHEGMVLDLVTPRSDINYIQIGEHYFYPYQNRYLVAVVRGPVTVLYCKKIVARASNEGVYGTTTSTAAVRSFSSFDGQGDGGAIQNITLELSPQTRVRVEENFYFLHNDRVTRASQNSFSRLFPAELRADIRAFISENRTDFSKMEDLTAITLHFNQRLMQ